MSALGRAYHEAYFLPRPLWEENYTPGNRRRRRAVTKVQEWEIIRIRGKSAVHIGYVHAPDEKSAIETAIEEYKITNPNEQKRLAARRHC